MAMAYTASIILIIIQARIKGKNEQNIKEI